MKTATHSEVADRLAAYTGLWTNGSDMTRFMNAHGLCIAGGAVHAAVVMGDDMPRKYTGDLDLFVSPNFPDSKFNQANEVLKQVFKCGTSENVYLVNMVRPWQRDNGVVYIVRDNGPMISLGWAAPFDPKCSDFDGVANLYFPSDTESYHVDLAKPLRIVNCDENVAEMMRPYRPLQAPYERKGWHERKGPDDDLVFENFSRFTPPDSDGDTWYGSYSRLSSDCCVMVPIETYSSLKVCRVFCPRMLSRLSRTRKYLRKGHTTGDPELDAEILGIRLFGAHETDQHAVHTDSAENVVLSMGPYQVARAIRVVERGDKLVLSTDQSDDWSHDFTNRKAVTPVPYSHLDALREGPAMADMFGRFANKLSVPDICAQVPEDPLVRAVVGINPARFCAIVKAHAASGWDFSVPAATMPFTQYSEWAHECGTLVPICARLSIPKERLVVVAKSFVAVEVTPFRQGTNPVTSWYDKTLAYSGLTLRTFFTKAQLNVLSWGGEVLVTEALKGFLCEPLGNWTPSVYENGTFGIRAKHLPDESPLMCDFTVRTGSSGGYNIVRLGSILLQPVSAVSQLLCAGPLWKDIPRHFLDDCKDLDSLTTTKPDMVVVDNSSGQPRILLKRLFTEDQERDRFVPEPFTSDIRLCDKFGPFGRLLRLVPVLEHDPAYEGNTAWIWTSRTENIGFTAIFPEDTVPEATCGDPINLVLEDTVLVANHTYRPSSHRLALKKPATPVIVNSWLYVLGGLQRLASTDAYEYARFDGVRDSIGGVYPVDSGHAVIGVAVVVSGFRANKSLVLYTKKGRPTGAPRVLESVEVRLNCQIAGLATSIVIRIARVIDPWTSGMVPQIAKVPTLDQVLRVLPFNGMAFVMPKHMHSRRPTKNSRSEDQTPFAHVSAHNGNTALYDQICNVASTDEPPACVVFDKSVVIIDYDRVNDM